MTDSELDYPLISPEKSTAKTHNEAQNQRSPRSKPEIASQKADLTTTLLNIASRGDVDELKSILHKNNLNLLNILSSTNESLLHSCLQGESKEMLDFLLESVFF